MTKTKDGIHQDEYGEDLTNELNKARVLFIKEIQVYLGRFTMKEVDAEKHGIF